MEFLILALLLLSKKDGEKNGLAPIINALIENKEVMNALLKAIAENGGQSAPAAEQKNSAPEEKENGNGNRAEAIEKFLNGYFK